MMADALPRPSWREQLEIVLRKLDGACDLSDQLPKTRHSQVHLQARHVTSQIRRRLAGIALEHGQLKKAAVLTIGALVAGRSPHVSRRLAGLLMDSGHPAHALLYFGAAADFSDRNDVCSKTMFELGHCAKLAGNYALASECFSFVLAQGWNGETQGAVPSDDLKDAISGLTGSFRLG